MTRTMLSMIEHAASRVRLVCMHICEAYNQLSEAEVFVQQRLGCNLLLSDSSLDCVHIRAAMYVGTGAEMVACQHGMPWQGQCEYTRNDDYYMALHSST